MAKYLVIHALPTPVPRAQADEVAKVAKANSTADAYWVGSWAQLDDKGNISKILCEWDAKNADMVKNLMVELGKIFPNFPVDGPYPMIKVEGESYR